MWVNGIKRWKNYQNSNICGKNFFLHYFQIFSPSPIFECIGISFVFLSSWSGFLCVDVEKNITTSSTERALATVSFFSRCELQKLRSFKLINREDSATDCGRITRGSNTKLSHEMKCELSESQHCEAGQKARERRKERKKGRKRDDYT